MVGMSLGAKGWASLSKAFPGTSFVPQWLPRLQDWDHVKLKRWLKGLRKQVAGTSILWLATARTY